MKLNLEQTRKQCFLSRLCHVSKCMGMYWEMLVRTNLKVLLTLAQIPKHCLSMTDRENNVSRLRNMRKTGEHIERYSFSFQNVFEYFCFIGSKFCSCSNVSELDKQGNIDIGNMFPQQRLQPCTQALYLRPALRKRPWLELVT